MDIDSFVELALIAIGVVSLLSWLWRRVRSKDALRWPTTEGNIESGTIEVVAHLKGGDISLPVFAFSYRVTDRYHSGRFALRPYITDPGPSVLDRMKGRKLQIHYNPRRTEEWFIADEYIEGCRVEQKLSPDFVNYEPRP